MHLDQLKTLQKRAHHLLTNYLSSEMPSKVFLFEGESGIGKKTMARSFAKAILSKTSQSNAEKKLTSGNHPDLHEYFPESKGGFHLVASMRAFIKEITLPPLESIRKVFIIYDIEKALDVSMQALLKSLEEPTTDTIIILIANRLDSIPSTILSRCVKVPFHPISPASIFETLKGNATHSDEKLEKISKVCFGSLTRAKRLLETKEVFLHEKIEHFFKDFPRKNFSALLENAMLFEKLCFVKESVFSEDEFFELVYLLFRDLSLGSICDVDVSFPWTDKPLQVAPSVELESLEKLIILSKAKLKSFIKPKAVILEFFLTIQDLLTQHQIAKL